MSYKEILEKYLKKIPKPFNSIIENGDKADFFAGLDIEKPETLSPMEMELRIQADRVMFSLNKAAAVLSVMAHMPFLLENDSKILKDNFSEEEMAFIDYVLKSYEGTAGDETPHYIGDLYDTINRVKPNKIRSRNTQDVAIDGNLSQVIHMIFTNKCIRQEISNAENPITIPYVVRFIRDFEQLKEMAKIKLYVTGTEEEARDKQLRQAYKSSVMLIAAIKDLEQQLETQREQLGNELNKKVEIFEKYNKKISDIKEEFQISIEKNIHESERKMMQQCLESEEKQAALSIEAEAITSQYEKLLEDDLDDEKKLRAKTMKTHTQLQNWLTKYDQDIGEKQAEYEELKAQYDTEKEAMDDLDNKIEDQDRLYKTLMAEKEEEEERLFQEIAYKILMNRSARIIQRAWRAFRERRHKRRGRKGKKGKDGKPKLTYTKKDDPNAVLETKFKGEVFEEMKNPNAF